MSLTGATRPGAQAGKLRNVAALALALSAGVGDLRFPQALADEAVSVHAKSGAAKAQEDDVEVRHVVVTVRKSRTLRVDWPFVSAIVGSTEIADVLPMTDRVLYIQGKKVGTTNVSIFDKDKRLVGVIDIEVAIDTANLADKIRVLTKNNGIRVSSNDDQVVLSGDSVSAVDADRAVAIAKDMQPEARVINAMRVVPSPVAPAQQVLLKVRFLEADRTAARELGINLFAGNSNGRRGFNTGKGDASEANRKIIVGEEGTYTTTNTLPLFGVLSPFPGYAATVAPFGVALANLVNKGATVDVMISALEGKGLVRYLAEPELIAISGDTASFLAGGQIPVPVVQPGGNSSTITIQWQPYGVQLTFAPTVVASGNCLGSVGEKCSSAGIINLRLTPSVSQLDYANAVNVQGYPIPALTVREARTMIELRDGQSFAIAGLLQTEGRREIEQLPWIGNLPVLGALFRSAAYQQKETDLVVIVTPHLVAPIVPGQQIGTPFDQLLPGNDVDFFLLGQPEIRKRYTEYLAKGGSIKGPYGHIIPMEPKQP